MPLTPATLNAGWREPDGPFWTPKLAGRQTPCLSVVQPCAHARCLFLHRVVVSKCRLCRERIGWGRHLKPDPQPQLFGPRSFVHVECDAVRVGAELLAAARRT